MQEGGRNARRQFNQNPGLSHCAAGLGKTGRDRTARFNNVLETSVQECTVM